MRCKEASHMLGSSHMAHMVDEVVIQLVPASYTIFHVPTSTDC